MWEDDEARLIAESTQAIVRTTGKKPEGWLGPYLAQSRCTLDLLKEAGYSYVMDWPADDQPFWMRTRSGPILSVPYPLEINDSPALVVRRHTPVEFEQMIIDQFEEMLDQSEEQPLVCGISLHTMVVGQPFRLRSLRRVLKRLVEHPHRDRVWFTRPGAIYDHCAALPPGMVPGSGA
jgi:peptidoglycan/xylan/chitin deacetylase (PgdA/CDA1 family)